MIPAESVRYIYRSLGEEGLTFLKAPSLKEKVAERLSQIFQRPILSNGTSSTMLYVQMRP